MYYVALVDTLMAKTHTWEQDRGITFAYDGVPLLAMLDEYVMLRHDREVEKKRLRVSQYCPYISLLRACLAKLKRFTCN